MELRPVAPVDCAHVLEGQYAKLEPVNVEKHLSDLFEAGKDPDIWTYMPFGPFDTKSRLENYVSHIQSQDDWRGLAIIDNSTGKALGMTCYVRMKPNMATIELGAIWFGPELKRTRMATEAIYLQMVHAFDDLGYRRVEWKCDNLNEASKAAARRFGFLYEGLFRQHMIIKGRNRDTAWFSVLNHDWPVMKARFEAWLDPENFDEEGRQIKSL